MFDAILRRRINPPLDFTAQMLGRMGLAADHVTLVGFAFGCAAAVAIATGYLSAALGFIAANRLADGLDGAVARASAATDRGGFLDISLDFVFYASVPLAFAVLDPARNALPAAILLSCFLANGAAFFAFALMAERRGITSQAQGLKSLYYVAGLAEGAETIAAFALFCLFPAAFPWLAAAFAALCALSAIARIVLGWRLLS
ncbi:MAG: CDP-alcohol phosphatidyltransferase family protein [Hyphomicrobiales bacterium]|nr:CDP-alcohol phosphatidyltransferase family protein [Hyphomicrobiales bacterium]